MTRVIITDYVSDGHNPVSSNGRGRMSYTASEVGATRCVIIPKTLWQSRTGQNVSI